MNASFVENFNWLKTMKTELKEDLTPEFDALHDSMNEVRGGRRVLLEMVKNPNMSGSVPGSEIGLLSVGL